MAATEWETRRARFVVRRVDVRGADAPLASATKAGVSLREDLEISVWNPESDVSNYKLVEPDDFVVGLRSFQHGISHSTVRGLVSPAYTVLRCAPDLEPRYYKHYFRSSILISQLANITQGIRQGQTIDMDAFMDLPLLVPPIGEQQRIADHLDTEVARIDEVASARAHQVDLIDLQAAVLITQTFEALTAEHGSIRLRYLTKGIEQGWSPQCEDRLAEPNEWGVLKAGCVNGGVFREDQHKTLSSGLTPRTEYAIKPGDLLMSRASGSVDLIGSAAVVPPGIRPLLLCDKVYRIRLENRCATSEFVAVMLRSHWNREHIKMRISGAEGMANNLPISVVRDCEVPRVPVHEQTTATSGLNRQLSHLDDLRQLMIRQGERLIERRQALITAAVTGQFDVTTARGAANVE